MNEVLDEFCGLIWVVEVDIVGHGLTADGVIVDVERDNLGGVGAVYYPRRGRLYCVESLHKSLERGRELCGGRGLLVMVTNGIPRQ